jgi:hypothetical protein
MIAGLVVAVAALLVAWAGFFFFRDNFSTHYAAKVVSAEAFRNGEIPWWNFYDSGGQPLAGNPNLLTFYPDNILYLFLPGHVAFNLHFLIHIIAGWVILRALCRARGVSDRSAMFAATVYALSGVVVSTTAFYNLITAVALIPLALLGVEQKSWRLLGMAFGLMLLAAEPVTLVAAALTVAICGGLPLWPQLLRAIPLAAAIGLPQIIAYLDIAADTERAVRFSARTVLTTSLTPLRVAELFLWPFSGFLNDTMAGEESLRLFSTLFVGVIAVPALFRRSRYNAAAVVLLLIAIGRYNPLIRWLAELESVRIMRFPEKFALPLVVVLVVSIAAYFERTRFKLVWAVVTIVPLLVVAWKTLPIDWYAPYDVPEVRQDPNAPGAGRIHVAQDMVLPGAPARVEYRRRAELYLPNFGSAAGVRYAVERSADGMHSLFSRIATERFGPAPLELKRRYIRIAGGITPGALPHAFIVPRTIPAHSLHEVVTALEKPDFDEHEVAVAPLKNFVSAPGRVVAYREQGQTIEIDVEAAGPVLLFVNQTYFKAWVARADGRTLKTVPLDLDRMGVLVPGSARITLTFGRYRAAVIAAWIVSSLLLLAVLAVEVRDRRTRQVERPADEEPLAV